MSCVFCRDTVQLKYSFPQNNFNGKLYKYVRCGNCKLVYLDTLPGGLDYEVMYPPSYQSSVVQDDIQDDPDIKLPGLRFSYGFQFELIQKLSSKDARILDYGCGAGHFVGNANEYGFKCEGAEFSSEYVSILSKGFIGIQFYAIDEVLSDQFTEKYDVIRLSNVLEHLTAPDEIINELSLRLKPDGILLVEGPIEDNFCLATAFRKFYFRVNKLIRPDHTVSEPPFHIFFSNAKNQRSFFNNCGFEELYFKTAEDPWPFPTSIKSAKGLKNKTMAIVAKISTAFTRTFGSRWGNIFIYVGKRKS